ncbi:hypothetical protein [Streptomyces sp. DT171]|uniref:hypothetical protein n=1 Tax=Streptomyces sp. DT171 TaxID=3416524 RepID=UPI003CEC4C48
MLGHAFAVGRDDADLIALARILLTVAHFTFMPQSAFRRHRNGSPAVVPKPPFAVAELPVECIPDVVVSAVLTGPRRASRSTMLSELSRSDGTKEPGAGPLPVIVEPMTGGGRVSA